ncbi:MAG: ARMT1-like domain-containing protein, partial [Promethearchaeia archaeon]
LLILGDNSGEIVFDRILIEILQELYPNLEIIYSVRAGPIINDATMEDAEFAGLTKIVKVIEAPAAPGIELSIASDEFKYYFLNESEVILSKGQGNFESLYGINMPNKEVYYLLKAKCNLMERIFNVKIGDLIFKKKTKDF